MDDKKRIEQLQNMLKTDVCSLARLADSKPIDIWDLIACLRMHITGINYKLDKLRAIGKKQRRKAERATHRNVQ